MRPLEKSTQGPDSTSAMERDPPLSRRSTRRGSQRRQNRRQGLDRQVDTDRDGQGLSLHVVPISASGSEPGAVGEDQDIIALKPGLDLLKPTQLTMIERLI